MPPSSSRSHDLPSTAPAAHATLLPVKMEDESETSVKLEDLNAPASDPSTETSQLDLMNRIVRDLCTCAERALGFGSLSLQDRERLQAEASRYARHFLRQQSDRRNMILQNLLTIAEGRGQPRNLLNEREDSTVNVFEAFGDRERCRGAGGPTGKVGPLYPMVCPFYKRDPELSECALLYFVSISGLTRHLREHHGLEDFPDTQSQDHSTGVNEDIVELESVKRGMWYNIWDKLFPGTPRPATVEHAELYTMLNDFEVFWAEEGISLIARLAASHCHVENRGSE